MCVTCYSKDLRCSIKRVNRFLMGKIALSEGGARRGWHSARVALGEGGAQRGWRSARVALSVRPALTAVPEFISQVRMLRSGDTLSTRKFGESQRFEVVMAENREVRRICGN